MKTLIHTAVVLGLFCACTPMRYSQTASGQSITGTVQEKYDWGEVYCGEGPVCAEVEVRRVDIEPKDGGRVEVTLHNRTGVSVVVQIALEILAANETRLDSTSFQNVGIPPRQESVWTMPGIYRPGAKVRVILRSTRS